jgi:hypothetical protein
VGGGFELGSGLLVGQVEGPGVMDEAHQDRNVGVVEGLVEDAASVRSSCSGDGSDLPMHWSYRSAREL